MSQIAVRTFHDIRAALLARRELALLDVREEDPFAQAHPLFAANLPLSRLELEIHARVPRRDTPITVYDDGEGLAPVAAQRLLDLGYSDVALLDGGLSGWRNAGGELFRDVNVPSKAFGELVEAERHTPSLAAEEVQALLDARADAVILDARRFDEYQTMSIPGGISVPGAELVLRVAELAPDPRTRVIVNCAGRTRSIIGTQSLLNAGIPNPVAALRNGTIGWTLAGQQLEHGQTRRFGAISQGTRKAAAQRARAVADRAGVERLDLAGLAQWQDEHDRTTYLLDVRTPEEYEAGHLPGSRSTPGGQLVQETDHVASVRGARLVLVDDDGVRANMSASWLAQMGWQVAVLDGLSDADLSERRLERAAAEATPGRHHRPDHPRRLAGRTGHPGARLHRQRQLCETPHPRRRLGIAQPVEAGTGTAGHGRALRTHLRQQPAGALRRGGSPGTQRQAGVPSRRRHQRLGRRGPADGRRRKPVGVAAHRPLPPPLRRYRQSARSDAGLPGLGVRPGGATRSRRNPRLLRDLKPLPDEIGESSNRRRAGCGNDPEVRKSSAPKMQKPRRAGLFSTRIWRRR